MSDLEQQIRRIAKDGQYLCMLGGECIDLNEIADRITELERQLREANEREARDYSELMKECDSVKAQNVQLLTKSVELELQNEELRKDADRYQMLRRGQKWSVIDGAGETLRADDLDAAVDAALQAGKEPKE